MGKIMKYIEAPTDYSCAGPDTTLFLAGGITNSKDWQKEIVQHLCDTDLTLLNPRRSTWVEAESEAQIKWEHRHLLRANAVLFWFSCETVCPITLFELGSWVPRPKTLFIGCHPKYSRIQDVVIQTRLERPYLQVTNNLTALAAQVKEWLIRKNLATSQEQIGPGR
jgi:hypothetical protein